MAFLFTRSVFAIAIFVFVASLFFFELYRSDFEVERKGSVVDMRIEAKPASCGGKRDLEFNYISLRHESGLYRKNVNKQFCRECYIGQILEMKYLPGNYAVLFPNESVQIQFYASVLFGIVSLGIIFLYCLRKFLKIARPS